MTDKKPENTNAAQQTAPAASSSPGPASAAPKQTGQAGHAARKRRRVLPWAFAVVLLIAIALAAAVWYQQKTFKQTQSELATRVQGGVSAANQAAEQAQQALSAVREQSRQIATLESSLRDARDQARSLEQAFQTLTDSGSDLVLINDVEHLVTIAQQQLTLGGNVANAIISLETAQAQLARANRPTLASLQETINGDLDRLRAASTVDVAMLSTQLDELSTLISRAPLLVPDDAAPEPVVGAQTANAGQSRHAPAMQAADTLPPDAPWWRQGIATARDWGTSAWNAVRQDLGQFITVRRVDDPTALLMSPDQATRFREMLRLRVMTAQLALMMRQPKVWSSETDTLVKALETRYDSQSDEARRALKIARQMSDTTIDVNLPTVENSLRAIEALREAQAQQAEENVVDGSQATPEPAKSVEPGESTEPAESTESIGSTEPAESSPDNESLSGSADPAGPDAAVQE